MDDIKIWCVKPRSYCWKILHKYALLLRYSILDYQKYTFMDPRKVKCKFAGSVFQRQKIRSTFTQLVFYFFDISRFTMKIPFCIISENLYIYTQRLASGTEDGWHIIHTTLYNIVYTIYKCKRIKPVRGNNFLFICSRENIYFSLWAKSTSKQRKWKIV